MKIWYVDAFAHKIFTGNPAAVLLLDEFPNDKTCQNIAQSLNLSETSFVKQLGKNHFHIRWFSPKDEAPLCGHATIAAAHILKQQGKLTSDEIVFESKSGRLDVRCLVDEKYQLNFPAKSVVPTVMPDNLRRALNMGRETNVNIESVYRDDTLYFVLLSDKEDLVRLKPDLHKLKKLDTRAIVVTCIGDEHYDFYSRYFAPKVGIDEDPVCGSAHCRLIPYWADVLGKVDMRAYQASTRGGILDVHYDKDHQSVLITGKAIQSCELEIDLPAMMVEELRFAS